MSTFPSTSATLSEIRLLSNMTTHPTPTPTSVIDALPTSSSAVKITAIICSTLFVCVVIGLLVLYFYRQREAEIDDRGDPLTGIRVEDSNTSSSGEEDMKEREKEKEKFLKTQAVVRRMPAANMDGYLREYESSSGSEDLELGQERDRLERRMRRMRMREKIRKKDKRRG